MVQSLNFPHSDRDGAESNPVFGSSRCISSCGGKVRQSHGHHSLVAAPAACNRALIRQLGAGHAEVKGVPHLIQQRIGIQNPFIGPPHEIACFCNHFWVGSIIGSNLVHHIVERDNEWQLLSGNLLTCKSEIEIHVKVETTIRHVPRLHPRRPGTGLPRGFGHIERQPQPTRRFANHAPRLRCSGQHLAHQTPTVNGPGWRPLQDFKKS